VEPTNQTTVSHNSIPAPYDEAQIFTPTLPIRSFRRHTVTLLHVNTTSVSDGGSVSELARARRKLWIWQNTRCVDSVPAFTRCVTLEVTGWLHRAATLRGLIQCSCKHGERCRCVTLLFRMLIWLFFLAKRRYECLELYGAVWKNM